MNGETVQHHELTSDAMALRFAKVLERLGWIGMALLAATGIAHTAGAASLIPASRVVEYWHRPPAEFWSAGAGIEIGGLGWIVNHALQMDMLSLLAVALIALSPLAAVVAAIPSADRTYRYLLGALAADLGLALVLAIVL